MNQYELMVIFSSTLTEDEEKEQTRQVENLLNHEQATIHFVDHWGKRKLAYPIKKQRQGYYEWFYFEQGPGRIAEIDRKLKMDEPVLRFMILKMEKLQIENMNKEIARRKEAAATPPPVAAPETAATQPAAEPAAEPVVEPVAEPVAEPVTETAAAEPSAEPAKES